MTKHTPSTTDIRIRYERYREQEQQRGADGVTPVTAGEFERWYAAERAAAKAQALREAAQMLEDAANLHDHPAHQVASEALRIAQRRLELRADGIERTTDER